MQQVVGPYTNLFLNCKRSMAVAVSIINLNSKSSCLEEISPHREMLDTQRGGVDREL